MTNWTIPFALGLQTKLHCVVWKAISWVKRTVESIYLESTHHSNTDFLHVEDGRKRYIGIAKASFAYAVQASLEADLNGGLDFRAIQICWITNSRNLAHVRSKPIIHTDSWIEPRYK